MKLLISILSVGFLASCLQAEEQLQPTLTVLTSAHGDLATGVTKSGKINLPQDVRLDPAPIADKETVEVHILHFVAPDLKKIEDHEKFLIALKSTYQRITKEELVSLIDAAGYRPARLEEMMAARPNLKLKGDVQVYGTKATQGDKSYAFAFKYEYRLGTYILAYVDGARPGMFPDNYEWYKESVRVAVVKKE
jgi:hypothetical protein